MLLFSRLFLSAAPVNFTPVISEVTVYRSGAKISSVATVKVPAGKSEVIFDNLSPSFNGNSLQVKIKGSATLVSAVFRLKTPGPAPENPRVITLRDSLTGLGDENERIRDERNVLGKEIELLDVNTKRVGTTLPGQTTSLTTSELKELGAFYRQRLLEIKARLLELTIKERKINDLYKKMQDALALLSPNTGNQTGEIALKIDAPAGQSLEITCIYLITQAGWTPLYDLRSEGLNKPLRLVYKANVFNQSGFDWKNINLHLSSATPMANNNRPIMTPVFADFRPLTVYNEQNRPEMNTYQMRDNMRASGSIGEQPVEDVDVNPATENDFLTAFDLSKPQDILADGKENIITVDEQDIPVTYEYHTVPKLEASVFLLAKVTDYGKYNLLPGMANLFFQETFVGQSFVNTQITSDTLILSLGRDDQMTVKRVKPQDFTDRKKIFDKYIKETYTYEISIKNNKSVPVQVNVLDQIPVSKQEDIKVELEDKGGARYNEEYGKMEWNIDIPPGQNKKVRFTYTLKYPKDKPVGITKG